MTLPLETPFAPMEARTVVRLPETRGAVRWQYEPKWDGFRCVALRAGAEVALWSKAGKPLTRYFPDVAANLRALPCDGFALDGELVVPVGDELSFDELLQRIHPAASRVARLAGERPALYVVFDLLVDPEGRRVLELPLEERRARLEDFAERMFSRAHGLALSPATTDAAIAERWLAGGGGALDGVIAKQLDAPYRSGERDAMQKVKRIRSADCVVGGFRWATGSRQVGSLLLGLYADDGKLDHVGFCSGIRDAERGELTRTLVGLQRRARGTVQRMGFDGDAPGGPSRWSTERSTEWEPLPHALVVEVSFDHVSGGRFRLDRHVQRLVDPNHGLVTADVCIS